MVKVLLLALIGYDLGAHFLHLLFTTNFFVRNKWVFWPLLHGRKYDLFWTLYWAIAFCLALVV